MKITELTPDPKNANLGTKRGRAALASSLKEYGAGRSILIDRRGVVIAGNKTLEQAIAAGHTQVRVVKTDGSELVAVQRTDLDLEDPKAKALAIADNRVAELDLSWNIEALEELKRDDVDLSSLWTEAEFEKLVVEAEGADERAKSTTEFLHVCPKCGHKFGGKEEKETSPPSPKAKAAKKRRAK